MIFQARTVFIFTVFFFLVWNHKPTEKGLEKLIFQGGNRRRTFVSKEVQLISILHSETNHRKQLIFKTKPQNSWTGFPKWWMYVYMCVCVWGVLPTFLRKRGNRMSMVKTGKGQAERGWSLVGSDPMVWTRVRGHTYKCCFYLKWRSVEHRDPMLIHRENKLGRSNKYRYLSQRYMTSVRPTLCNAVHFKHKPSYLRI